MKNYIYRTGMIFNEEPVADVLTFSINRNWFVVANVVDGKRNQFFRKLVRAVIV